MRRIEIGGVKALLQSAGRMWRSLTGRGLMAGLLCACICWLLNSASWVRDLENRAYDNCIGFRGGRSSTANVVIVALDEVSLQGLNKPLRYISPELAEVVTYLGRQRVAAIGIDLLWPETKETIPDLLPGRPGDASTMGRAIGETGNVVLPALIARGSTPQLPIFEWLPIAGTDWTDLGFADVSADADRRVRRGRLRASDRLGEVWPSFPLAVFGRARHLTSQWFDEGRFVLDGHTMPLDADRELLINYVGPRGTIPAVPFHQVLDAARGLRPASRDWQGAIVLVGVTTLVSEDLHPVPRLHGSFGHALRAPWLYHDAEEMPGVEVHANLIATMADKAFITTPRCLAAPLTLLLCGAVLGPILVRCSLEAGALVTIAHHFGWQLTCLLFFRASDLRVEMVAMLMLGPMLYGAIFALRWRWMRRMLGMIKSEAVARALEADPSKLELRGELRQITVVFIDVRNFTAFSEGRPAAEVVRLLNAFFAAVVPPIEAEKGIVNQYLGDGLMAIFGAPEQLVDHASRALRAAELILQRVHELSELWKTLGADSFRIGVGIHTGPAVVGAVGSPRRLDYTAIGDTVNTASRIEACNKQLATELLLSEAALRALPIEEQQQRSASLRRMAVQVKGKCEPVTVYALPERI